MASSGESGAKGAMGAKSATVDGVVRRHYAEVVTPEEFKKRMQPILDKADEASLHFESFDVCRRSMAASVSRASVETRSAAFMRRAMRTPCPAQSDRNSAAPRFPAGPGRGRVRRGVT